MMIWFLVLDGFVVRNGDYYYFFGVTMIWSPCVFNAGDIFG